MWCDPETDKVKIAKHARFDEGMNDAPIHKPPPNALQLHRLNSGEHFPAEELPSDMEKFEFHAQVFTNIANKVVRVFVVFHVAAW